MTPDARRIGLAVHAGAGPRGPGDSAREAAARAGLTAALEAGRELLGRGGAALDAAQAAVRELEACEVLNAGVGSVLTADGHVEMDACLADGATRRVGAVAALRRSRHPIDGARAVLEHGRHVLLVGEAADAFCARSGVEAVAPERLVTEARRRQLERARARDRVQLDHAGEGPDSRGTVGAVARDAAGHLAAATSTGGLTHQLPGRVGDSPVVGAGTWADDATCAVSATGEGELFLRVAFAHEVDARMRLGGEPLGRACEAALARVEELGGSGGCIAIGAEGPPVLTFGTAVMLRGWLDERGEARVVIGGDAPPAGAA